MKQIALDDAPAAHRTGLFLHALDELPVGQRMAAKTAENPAEYTRLVARIYGDAIGVETLGPAGGPWQVRCVRRKDNPPAKYLGNVRTDHSDTSGLVWRLAEGDQSFETHAMRLGAHEEVPENFGPPWPVLFHVVSGGGIFYGPADPLTLVPGAMLWLPARSKRRVLAGPNGLVYVSTHCARPV